MKRLTFLILAVGIANYSLSQTAGSDEKRAKNEHVFGAENNPVVHQQKSNNTAQNAHVFGPKNKLVNIEQKTGTGQQRTVQSHVFGPKNEDVTSKKQEVEREEKTEDPRKRIKLVQ